MRIVHISEAFGGGLRTAIVNYITATPQFDHTMYVRTRPGADTIDIPDTTTVEYYDGSIAGFLFSARGFVVANHFDLVHVHSSFAGLIRGILPKGTRIIYSPHCYAMEMRQSILRHVAYSTVEWTLAQRTQLLLAVSPREVQIGHRLNPLMPSREIRNAATSLPVVGAEASESDRPIIAMAGRICAQKGPEFFAQVCEILGPDRFRFVWIGDGDEGRDHLERAGVEITGWVTPRQSREILTSASLFVHSAAWEGGPLVTLEAADAGCPVIARTIASMESLGYHVGGESPALVAAHVERYFGETRYRELVRMQTKNLSAYNSSERLAESLGEAYQFAARRLGPQRSRSN